MNCIYVLAIIMVDYDIIAQHLVKSIKIINPANKIDKKIHVE
jgi:hypothetical protein